MPMPLLRQHKIMTTRLVHVIPRLMNMNTARHVVHQQTRQSPVGVEYPIETDEPATRHALRFRAAAEYAAVQTSPTHIATIATIPRFVEIRHVRCYDPAAPRRRPIRPNNGERRHVVQPH